MISSVNAHEQSMYTGRVTLLIHLMFVREGHKKMFMLYGLPSNVKKQCKIFMLSIEFPKDSPSKYQTQVGKTTIMLQIIPVTFLGYL